MNVEDERYAARVEAPETSFDDDAEARHERRAHPCEPAERDAGHDSDGFASALIAGLSMPAKAIPCRFFYDAAGSALFERITELPEYYPTRTETAILADHAAELADLAEPGAALIEFGSGSSTKTELLLERMDHLRAYVPIDISGAALSEAKARIAKRHPGLSVLPLEGDFSRPLRLPPEIARSSRLGFFPGSTIGNLRRGEAVALLANMRRILGDGARLIIGVDLKKDVRRLLAAYDDAGGVTAAFNLNLLARANRELGANFDLKQFSHSATYDVRHGRIDMHLVSRRAQTVCVCGRRFGFLEGERIHTEHSHKYDIQGFHALAAEAGWRPQAVWTDAERLFSVHVLVAGR